MSSSEEGKSEDEKENDSSPTNQKAKTEKKSSPADKKNSDNSSGSDDEASGSGPEEKEAESEIELSDDESSSENQDEESEPGNKVDVEEQRAINQEIREIIKKSDITDEEAIFKLKLSYESKKKSSDDSKINLQTIIEMKEAFDMVDFDQGGSIELDEFTGYFNDVFVDLLDETQLEKVFNVKETLLKF